MYSVSECGDLELAARLFREIRGFERPPEVFRWLYRDNPLGPSIVWMLSDPDGQPIGFTAGHRRQVWVRGEPRRALNCGDFCVAPGHRTLGPALVLRRPAKQLVDDGRFDFLYAHPVPAMLVVHRRVGHPRLAEMQRWVYPLRARRKLANRLGNALAAVVAPAADLALGLRRIWRRRRHGFEITEATGFGPEYDELDAALGAAYPVIGRRSAAHLAWRHRGDPSKRVTILEARDGGALVGYVLLDADSASARVSDIAFLPGREIEGALLDAALRRAVDAGAEGVSLLVQSGFPGEPCLRATGFWKREDDQPTVCYGGPGFAGKGDVEEASNWFMTAGDRDV